MKRIILLLIVLSSSFLLDAKDKKPSRQRRVYLKNLRYVTEFKKRMPENMKAYYLPRKKYIDKQPVNPEVGPFYQLQIIVQGTEWRDRNLKNNRREILKLENFLKTADDFQLSRYFSLSEEKYLGMKAGDAIAIIESQAKKDEAWRKKTDPIFVKYIEKKASWKERKYYKNNKSRFYSADTGWDLVQLLQKEAYAND
ncbi:MAG: hypothetical protein H7A24_10185 [Leptospiraceae bacterium]|nr:hypothetical protein [Leptospiraceae bacterium]MCP5512238.1 hypothetical protein [Leptospiraceae bacterium]